MYLALQFLALFVVLAFCMSLLEHQVHRRLMHRKTFLGKRFDFLKRAFEHHAVLHHGHYFKVFHDEPVPKGEDRGLRLNMGEGFVEALPVSLLIATFSYMGAILFPFVVCGHHYIWNQIHLEMHKPEGRYFSKWRIYKFLARHHYLHHRYPDRNFNVVLPIADYALSTNAHATEADKEGMRAVGIL
jgi:hypothetical protein